jgi:hypothetical protein
MYMYMYIYMYVSWQVEFENVMRRQIRHMAQSKLCLMPGVRSNDETEFMQYGTLKLMFMDQVLAHEANLHHRIACIN